MIFRIVGQSDSAGVAVGHGVFEFGEESLDLDGFFRCKKKSHIF